MKSLLGASREKKRKTAALCVAEWNAHILMDRPTGIIAPERQTALAALEMNRYNVDIAALSERSMPGYDRLEDHGYIFFLKWEINSRNERSKSRLCS